MGACEPSCGLETPARAAGRRALAVRPAQRRSVHRLRGRRTAGRRRAREDQADEGLGALFLCSADCSFVGELLSLILA